MIPEDEQKEVYMQLRDSGYKSEMRFNEPLYKHTTFKLGGPCPIFLLPDSTPDVRAAIRYFKQENMNI